MWMHMRCNMRLMYTGCLKIREYCIIPDKIFGMGIDQRYSKELNVVDSECCKCFILVP